MVERLFLFHIPSNFQRSKVQLLYDPWRYSREAEFHRVITSVFWIVQTSVGKVHAANKILPGGQLVFPEAAHRRKLGNDEIWCPSDIFWVSLHPPKILFDRNAWLRWLNSWMLVFTLFLFADASRWRVTALRCIYTDKESCWINKMLDGIRSKVVTRLIETKRFVELLFAWVYSKFGRFDQKLFRYEANNVLERVSPRLNQSNHFLFSMQKDHSNERNLQLTLMRVPVPVKIIFSPFGGSPGHLQNQYLQNSKLSARSLRPNDRVLLFLRSAATVDPPGIPLRAPAGKNGNPELRPAMLSSSSSSAGLFRDARIVTGTRDTQRRTKSTSRFRYESSIFVFQFAINGFLMTGMLDCAGSIRGYLCSPRYFLVADHDEEQPGAE